MANSRGLRKVELTLLEGDAFKHSLAAFMQEMLRKGVPSLYNDVCALLRMPVHGGTGTRFTLAASVEEFSECPRAHMVLDMVNTYVSSLRTTGLFPESTAECSPTVLLWALYLQAHLQEKFGGETVILHIHTQTHTHIMHVTITP